MDDSPVFSSSLNKEQDEKRKSSDETNSQSNENEDSDSDDEFYFESDHVALKNNKDYRELLKTLAILEAQRYRALKDIDTLVDLKKQVKADPMKFVENLTNDSIKIPEPQVIPPIPSIDWSQYNISISEVNKSISIAPTLDAPLSADELSSSAKDKILVRGRVFDESKPETFNQLWTVEEQQRLEELLIKYPPEEVETKRWKKIAAELGNRTARQVCSRVQKYFVKLQKAGLPIPGRAPKAHVPDIGKKVNKYPYRQRLFRPTTFFPSFFPNDVPVPLTETEEPQPLKIIPGTSLSEDKIENIDNSFCKERVADDKVKNIMVSRKLELLRKVLQVKEENDKSNIKHVGYQCNFCKEEPIIGVLWTCVVCPAVDFCTDCVVTQLESVNPHPLSHNIEPVRELEYMKIRRYDKDYLPPSFADPGCSYNYLDPNFLPGDDE